MCGKEVMVSYQLLHVHNTMSYFRYEGTFVAEAAQAKPQCFSKHNQAVFCLNLIKP